MINVLHYDQFESEGVDPRAIPQGQVSWNAAMRFRAARLPSRDSLKSLAGSEEAFDALNTLADMTDSRRRVVDFQVGHPTITGQPDMSKQFPAVFYQPAEWLFNDGTHTGFVVSRNMKAALSHAIDVYGGFLRDCGAGPTDMQFIVDRMQVNGTLHDLSDIDAFGGLYQSDDWKAGQATARNLLAAKSAGFIYGQMQQDYAVIYDSSIITDAMPERAIALKWDGNRFTRLFDYRDLYWKDL